MLHTTWFSDWLLRAWPRVHSIVFNDKWVGVLTLLATLGVLAGLGRLAMAVLNVEKTFLFYVNDVGHLTLLVLALFFFLPQLRAGRKAVPHEVHDPTDAAVNQFHHWLYGIVVLWIIFYVARFFADLPQNQGTDLERWAEAVSPYLNVLSSVPLFGLYIVLSKPSVGEFFWGMGARMWLILVVVIVISALQLWAQAGDDNDKGRELLAGISNGLVVGGCLALVVGRLDSRYIGLSGVVVSFLYLYALIQPLFPIVFEPGAEGVRLRVQYAFVALALIMKCTLIMTIGKVIDTWRAHFYLSNMRWLDAHAATMIAQHDAAMAADGVSRSAPPIFCFVHPVHRGAILRLEKLDIEVHLGLLNAWLGVGWDIKELRAECVVVSDTEIPVKIVRCATPGTLRIQDNNRHTLARVFIDLALDQAGMVHRLQQDRRIADAIKRKQKTTQVSLAVKGITAHIALLEDKVLQYVWTPIEEVNVGEGLFFECTINLNTLNALGVTR